MIGATKFSPTRLVASLTLGAPLFGVGMVVISSLGTTLRWSQPGILASIFGVLLITVGFLHLMTRAACAVAHRSGSARMSWLTYAIAMLSAWSAVAFLVFAGAQFHAPDGGGTSGFGVWAAGAILTGSVAFLAAFLVGAIAMIRSYFTRSTVAPG